MSIGEMDKINDEKPICNLTGTDEEKEMNEFLLAAIENDLKDVIKLYSQGLYGDTYKLLRLIQQGNAAFNLKEKAQVMADILALEMCEKLEKFNARALIE
jgi:hypothetical protein